MTKLEMKSGMERKKVLSLVMAVVNKIIMPKLIVRYLTLEESVRLLIAAGSKSARDHLVLIPKGYLLINYVTRMSSTRQKTANYPKSQITKPPAEKTQGALDSPSNIRFILFSI